MSYFHRLDDPLEESVQDHRQDKPSAGTRFAEFGDRIARAFATVDRGKVDRLPLEPGEVAPEDLVDHSEPLASAPRFAVGPFGYNRAAVDEYISDLERELEALRHERPAPLMSINEEIERIGEQTASILVVAHDQAHETTRRAQQQANETIRRAQEQADRCIADAASNAVETTERAKRQLRELDNETDGVWRERIRLLEDARSTGSALIALAEQATERFPEETKSVAPAGLQETEAMDPVGFQETEAMEPVGYQETEAMDPVGYQGIETMERVGDQDAEPATPAYFEPE